MTIRYENTFRDLMAFCFFHYLRSPFLIATYGVIFALLSFSIVQSLPGDSTPGVKLMTFLILELFVFLALAGFLSATVALSMVSRRNKTFLTAHTVTLADGSFIEETAYNRADHKWPGVQKLARTRSYIFIYPAQHMAHVIPRRAFRDEAEWDSFYEFCKKRSTGNS